LLLVTPLIKPQYCSECNAGVMCSVWLLKSALHLQSIKYRDQWMGVGDISFPFSLLITLNEAASTVPCWRKVDLTCLAI